MEGLTANKADVANMNVAWPAGVRFFTLERWVSYGYTSLNARLQSCQAT